MEFVTVFPYQICGYNPEVGRHRSSLHGHVVIQVIITPTTSCYCYCNQLLLLFLRTSCYSMDCLLQSIPSMLLS